MHVSISVYLHVQTAEASGPRDAWMDLCVKALACKGQVRTASCDPILRAHATFDES